MKAKIKVRFSGEAYPIEIIEKGDWIDLRATEDITLKGPYTCKVKIGENAEGKPKFGNKVKFSKHMASLGVAISVPKGYESHVLPRSSTPEKFQVILLNSEGIIDNSYHGNEDIWRFNVIAYDDAVIHKGDRVAQFRIELSQKATVGQKLKWLFTNGVKIEVVDDLKGTNRGGIGTTGVR